MIIIAVACQQCSTLVEPPRTLCTDCAVNNELRALRQIALEKRERFFVLGAAVAHYAASQTDDRAVGTFVASACGRQFAWVNCSFARARRPLCGNCARGIRADAVAIGEPSRRGGRS